MTSADSSPVELELKFLVPPDAERVLDTHPALQTAATSKPRHEVTTYFDTESWELARHGATVRIRRRDHHRIQTLKLRDPALGPFARHEWEWPVRTDTPSLERLAESPAKALLNGSLRPVFVTDIERRLRTLHLDGSIVELALDRGSVLAGEASEPICELELELKQGDPAPLYRLAAALHAALPMTIGSEAKSDRGRRLCTGQTRPAAKGHAVDLPADVTAADAFGRNVSAVLATLLANQPAAAAGDVEGVHQIRVCIRRLRALLVLFRPVLEPHAEARFTAVLRELGQVFGAARDWDVFCTEMLEAAAADGVAASWLDLLRQPAAEARAGAHRRLTETLHEPRFTALVLGLAAWAADPAALAGAPEDGRLGRRLEGLAPDLILPLQAKVRRRGRKIDERSDQALHALRKSVKKLRYGVEFLGPLWPHKRVKAYLHACKALQNRLGEINDAVTLVALAERLGGARQAELAPAVAELAGWAERRRDKARGRLKAEWRAFKSLSLPAG